jgi:hypothetical protein
MANYYTKEEIDDLITNLRVECMSKISGAITMNETGEPEEDTSLLLKIDSQEDD